MHITFLSASSGSGWKRSQGIFRSTSTAARDSAATTRSAVSRGMAIRTCGTYPAPSWESACTNISMTVHKEENQWSRGTTLSKSWEQQKQSFPACASILAAGWETLFVLGGTPKNHGQELRQQRIVCEADGPVVCCRGTVYSVCFKLTCGGFPTGFGLPGSDGCRPVPG